MQTTRAIAVKAPPQSVFPWLAQLGQGRGGFYSYDWLENRLGLDIHSADRILPEFQDLQIGDGIAMAPGPPFFGFLVADVVAPAHLVFEMRIHPFTGLPQGPDASAPTVHASWAFDLVPIGESSCRLIARNRASVHLPFGLGLPYRLLLEWVEFVMERRMLIGIRDRAERGDSTPIPDHWFGASGDADAEATARDIPTQADGWRRRGEPRRHSDRQFGSRNEA